MATEKWLIDANALKMTMFALTEYLNNESIFIDVIINAIDSYYPLDAVEVVHGRWEKAEYHGFLRCSECKDVYIDDTWVAGGKWNYCPNCGAKMDGDESEL